MRAPRALQVCRAGEHTTPHHSSSHISTGAPQRNEPNREKSAPPATLQIPKRQQKSTGCRRAEADCRKRHHCATTAPAAELCSIAQLNCTVTKILRVPNLLGSKPRPPCCQRPILQPNNLLATAMLSDFTSSIAGLCALQRALLALALAKSSFAPSQQGFCLRPAPGKIGRAALLVKGRYSMTGEHSLCAHGICLSNQLIGPPWCEAGLGTLLVLYFSLPSSRVCH